MSDGVTFLTMLGLSAGVVFLLCSVIQIALCELYVSRDKAKH